MNRAPPSRRGWVRAGTSLLSLASLGVFGLSCGASDECQIGQSRCEGNTVQYCGGPPCAEISCPGNQWRDTNCIPEASCVVSKQKGAVCVLSPVLDPLCHDDGYCAGNEIVYCVGEYASGRRYDCSAGCGGRTCVSTAGKTPGIGVACSGDSTCFSGVDNGYECQAPQVCGALVTWQQLPGPPPAALGGVIIPCHYTLTQAGFYGEPSGVSNADPFRESLDISADSIAEAHASELGYGQAWSGLYAVSGTSLSWNVTCPANLQNVSGIWTYSYTATPTQLILYDAAAQSVRVYERTP